MIYDGKNAVVSIADLVKDVILFSFEDTRKFQLSKIHGFFLLPLLPPPFPHSLLFRPASNLESHEV